MNIIIMAVIVYAPYNQRDIQFIQQCMVCTMLFGILGVISIGGFVRLCCFSALTDEKSTLQCAVQSTLLQQLTLFTRNVHAHVLPRAEHGRRMRILCAQCTVFHSACSYIP